MKSAFQMTPAARYRDDIEFRRLCDMLEAYIHATKYTPTEMREAAMMAAINYEMHQVKHAQGFTMSNTTAAMCWDRIDELYKAIQTDERGTELMNLDRFAQ